MTITEDIDCAGADNGSITATAGGGVQPYTYSLNGGPFQSSNVFSDLLAGEYTVTVMDAAGFSQNSNPITLTEPAVINGGTNVNGYTVTVNASGGTGDLEYSLDGGPFQSSTTFFPVATGTHTVTIRDENDCEITLNVSVNVAVLAGELNFDALLDCHDSADGIITVDPSGGVGPYEYSLNGGAFQGNNQFTGLSAGNYEVTIRDVGGFEVTLNAVTIAAPSPITGTADVNGNDVTVNASGGTGALMYSLDGGPFQSSNIFLNVMNGSHTITVKDANGCTIDIELDVVAVPLDMTAQLTQGISCVGASDAIIVINASGGAEPLQYSIDGVNFQTSNIFENLPVGTYEPTVQDATGATSTAPSIVINEPALLELMGTAFGPEITVEAEGGTGDYEYSLEGGPFQSDNMFMVSMNGLYTITVMDENGCTEEVEIEVNMPEALFTNVTGVSCPDFVDGVIIIDGVQGGEPPYQFSLNGGPFSSQTTYENLAVGDYTIVVMDATGFEWEAPMVTVEAPASIDLSTTLDNNNLTVNASGGTGDFQYSIDGGLNFQDENLFSDLPNGVYAVVVMDENGCQVETNVTINYNSVFEIGADLYFEILPNPSTGVFLLRVSTPLVEELSYTVYDMTGRMLVENKTIEMGATEHLIDLAFLASGTYQLKVTNGRKMGDRTIGHHQVIAYLTVHKKRPFIHLKGLFLWNSQIPPTTFLNVMNFVRQ